MSGRPTSAAPIPIYGRKPGSNKKAKDEVSAEERVREEYLNSTQMQAALRDALKGLFTQTYLPDNPYYFLAKNLSTYVDQTAGWKLGDSDLASKFDADGECEVVEPNTRLCKHSNTGYAYGLPHVIRLTSKKGVNILHSITHDQLPDSFFPNSQPFTMSDDGGYEIQIMCSVQGFCALWHPESIDLPELEVRADVLVKGPSLEEAVQLFLDIIVNDIEDLNAVPLYFVEGIKFIDPPSQPMEGEWREPLEMLFSLEDIYNKPAEYEKTGMRLVLGNKCAVSNAVVMMDEASGALGNAPGLAPPIGSNTLRYKMVRKTYYFHFASIEESKLGFDQFTHYGSHPYEALFEGYFADKMAAKQYMRLFLTSKPSSRDPYHEDNINPNVQALRQQISLGLNSDNSLSAFRQTLLLVLLEDNQTVRRPLDPDGAYERVADLEDLVMRAQRSRSVMGCIPNLLRIMFSLSELLRGVTHEVEAVRVVSDLWPSKLAYIMKTAGKEPGSTPYLRQDGLYSAPGTGDSRRTLRTPEVSDAMLVWLKTFDMDQRLCSQLIQLKKQIFNCTGKRLFSGCSTILNTFFAHVPEEVPQTGAAAVLRSMKSISVYAESLLHVLALTVSHGFLDRCHDVDLALQTLEIPITNHEQRNRNYMFEILEDDVVMPKWVLDAESVVGSQVSSGALPARVGAEGVILQYAVDTSLDQLLSMLWHQATQPPLPANPYPKLMHLIRSQAAKMELWNEEESDVVEVLMNDLHLGESPLWMYSAAKSPRALEKTRKRLQGLPGLVTTDSDNAELANVYGCYSAVSLADSDALQALNTSIPGLFTDRHWQRGAYLSEVIPSLLGDCCMTNAMVLDDLVTPAMFKPGRKYRKPSPYEHPRFYSVTAEEHHLVNGPNRKDASQEFAKAVIESLLNIHETTQHLVHHVSIGQVGSAEKDMLYGMGNVASHAPQASTRPSSAKSKGGPKVYKLSDLRDEYSQDRAVEDLAYVARNCQQGTHIALVQLYASSHANMYVSVRRLLTFQYSKVKPQLKLHISVTNSAKGRKEDQHRPSTAERSSLYWDRYVYSRVFLSEHTARVWYTWNRDKGDPSQPYHYQNMVDESQAEIKRLQASGKMLEMIKLKLICALAVQDDTGIFKYSRVCMSTSQELKAMMELNVSLVDLLKEDLDPLVKEKIENEQLRRTFIMYINRLRTALGSPKYCYFSGMTTLVPAMLSKIRDRVLSEFKLEGECLRDMITLNVWTKACESSVAAALYESFAEPSELAQINLYSGY